MPFAGQAVLHGLLHLGAADAGPQQRLAGGDRVAHGVVAAQRRLGGVADDERRAGVREPAVEQAAPVDVARVAALQRPAAGVQAEAVEGRGRSGRSRRAAAPRAVR